MKNIIKALKEGKTIKRNIIIVGNKSGVVLTAPEPNSWRIL